MSSNLVKPLKIAIEPSLTVAPNVTGIHRYTRNLLRSLPALISSNQTNGAPVRIELLEVPYPTWLARFPWGAMRKVLYLAWLNGCFPRWLRKHHVDLVHHTNFLAPLGAQPSKTVVTIHDMRYHMAPGVSRIYYWYRQLLIGASVRRANAVIAISKQTASELTRVFPACSRKLVVIHHGIEDPDGDIRKWEPACNKHSRDLLMIGPFYKLKNHIVGLEAFAQLAKEGYCGRLLIAGERRYEYARLSRYVCQRNLNDVVHFLGYVDKRCLRTLYAKAYIFLFPSVLEGFGYPILEAMAAGVPVIASDIAVAHEVGHTAAVYAQPGDPVAWKEKIVLLQNSAVHQRYAALGRDRARLFTLELEARATYDLYLKVFAENC